MLLRAVNKRPTITNSCRLPTRHAPAKMRTGGGVFCRHSSRYTSLASSFTYSTSCGAGQMGV